MASVQAAALEEAKNLRAMIEERLTCVEVLRAELSPALGVHTGPGTAGVCYFFLSRDRLACTLKKSKEAGEVFSLPLSLFGEDTSGPQAPALYDPLVPQSGRGHP